MEFWQFHIFAWVGLIGFLLWDYYLLLYTDPELSGWYYGILDIPYFFVFWLATIFPAVTVSVRRMRDIDRSGWLVLLKYLPIVPVILDLGFWYSLPLYSIGFLGWLVFMILCCFRGSTDPTRFGGNPFDESKTISTRVVTTGGDDTNSFLQFGIYCLFVFAIVAIAILFNRHYVPYLLNTDFTETVERGMEVEIPATELLPNSARYICVWGPYSSPARRSSNYSDIDISSVQDQLKGKYVWENNFAIGYFDQDATLLQYDEHVALGGRFGWQQKIKMPASNLGCYNADDVIFRIQNEKGAFNIGIYEK